VFTPTANFNGPASFTYIIDSRAAARRPPSTWRSTGQRTEVANADIASTPTDDVISIAVLANDTPDGEGNP
jgi:hypothetical protein